MYSLQLKGFSWKILNIYLHDLEILLQYPYDREGMFAFQKMKSILLFPLRVILLALILILTVMIFITHAILLLALKLLDKLEARHEDVEGDAAFDMQVLSARKD